MSLLYVVDPRQLDHLCPTLPDNRVGVFWRGVAVIAAQFCAEAPEPRDV